MAGFAALSGAASTHLLHALLELPFVWIKMAAGTGKLLPVIDHCLRLESIALFMTIAAGNSFVTTR